MWRKELAHLRIGCFSAKASRTQGYSEPEPEAAQLAQR